MADTIKHGHEIPTIDVAMIAIKKKTSSDTDIFILDTANKLGVNVQTETADAVKLVVKGRLIAQKPEEVTITGNTLVLTDNVFNPEVVKLLQGGTILYWANEGHTSTQTTDAGYGVAQYAPPVAGSSEKGEVCVLMAYSAIYNAAGIITGYEKITYPNCTGTPVALSAEDGAFRAPEYTIYSAPDTGEAPYTIDYIGPNDLPTPTTVSAGSGT